jgi:hypothetical protein
MATMTTEIGTLASEAIAELYAEVAGADAARGDAVWAALVEAEWPSATQVEAEPDESLDLRAIQQIARATGRHAAATPIASTLLAATWHRGEDLDPRRPILIATPRDGGAVALDAVADSLLAGGPGLAASPEPTRIDTFVPGSRTFVYAADAVAPVTGDQLAQTRAVYAAIAVGAADAAIDKSVAWVATRQQFGQPIARFQAVRHHLANMHIAREQAWTAAIVAGVQPEQSERWAPLAARLSRRAVELAVQVHGGVGFTVEVGLHAYLNRTIEIASTVGAAR